MRYNNYHQALRPRRDEDTVRDARVQPDAECVQSKVFKASGEGAVVQSDCVHGAALRVGVLGHAAAPDKPVVRLALPTAHSLLPLRRRRQRCRVQRCAVTHLQ